MARVPYASQWLAVAACLLLNPVLAAAQPVQSSQSVDVSARVCDEQVQAPTITAPPTGSTYQTSIVRFEGTAGVGRTVTLLRNQLVAGTAVADSTGRWQLQLTLVVGTNTVVAKDCYDSPPVVVYYSPAVPRGSFFLTVDVGVYTLKAGETAQFSVTINGGNGPFAVRSDWGDGSTTEQHAEGRAVANPHKYESSATYQIETTATDRDGRQAAITSVAKAAPADDNGGIRAEPANWIFWGGLLASLAAVLLSFLFLRYWRHRHVNPR